MPIPVGTRTITYPLTHSCGHRAEWTFPQRFVDDFGPNLIIPMLAETISLPCPRCQGVQGIPDGECEVEDRTHPVSIRLF